MIYYDKTFMHTSKKRRRAYCILFLHRSRERFLFPHDLGTNWILGWSRRPPAEDRQIRRRFPEGRNAVQMLKAFLDEGR